MKVNESYDVGLDIAFHFIDKVKKVSLCVLRVACRTTTSFFLVTKGKNVFHHGTLSIRSLFGLWNRNYKPFGRETDHFQREVNVNFSYVWAGLQDWIGMLDAARTIFNATWMSSTTCEHTYENTNGILECVGYHIANCAAIRTKAMIMFKKQAQLMLTRPPPPQFLSFFANSAWLLTRNNQRSKSLHTQRHDPGTRCDQSRQYLRKNIDTYNITTQNDMRQTSNITLWYMLLLHCIWKSWHICTHTMNMLLFP